MNAKAICLGCGQALISEGNRNRHRQRFCLEESCQRVRRAESQRQRRARARKLRSLAGAMPGLLTLLATPEAGVRPSEAVLGQFPAVFIGLISQFVDSMAREDIEAFLRRCVVRGNEILHPPKVQYSAQLARRKPDARNGRPPQERAA